MTRILRSGAAIATAIGILAPTSAGAVTTTGSLALSPVQQPSGSIQTTPITMSYQVKKGDTVSEIALRTGSKVSDIIKANSLNSRALIFPGQKLTIPSPAATTSSAPKPAATPAKPATAPAAAKVSVHVVRAGDTLGAIAKQYATTIAELTKANSLSNPNRIYVGQRIQLSATSGSATTSSASKPTQSTPAPAAKPAATASSTTHTVRAGDTLGAIARKYSTTVAAISSANNISNPNRISVGQKLTIGAKASAPAASTPAATTPAVSTTSAAPASYTVQSGDTLSTIAARFNVSVASLTASNGISNPNAIWVGQKLTLGGSAASSTRPALVTNNFPGYTYSDATVSAANQNKYALIEKSVPSPAQVQQMVRDTAISMGVDPKLALAHAYVESGFNATAVSPANAIGTMQVIPSSGEWASQLVGRKLDLLDPQDNITAGVAIIRSLHNSTSNFDHAIGGYYQGLGGVQRNGMRPDTVNYVAKVKNAMARF